MKSKIVGVSVTFSIDPELGTNAPFSVSGSVADLSSLSKDMAGLLTQLADLTFPLEQVQIAMSAMAQADYAKQNQPEITGIDYTAKTVE